MKKRIYKDKSDVTLLMNFNAETTAKVGGCGYLHPGDIPHHIFGGNKWYDPSELLTIWEDNNGIAAWLLINPRFRCYDAQFRPELRGGEFEREILDIAFEQTAEKMRKYEIDSDTVFEEVFCCDKGRMKILEESDWTCTQKPAYVLNRTDLKEIPEPVLPEGYSIRSVKGIEEAAAVAEVHSKSFNTNWPPELYEKYMQAPGYSPDHEYVVVAPDGSFAAFTVTWHDRLNRTGLFEPVGTHKDHRRLGLGQAVVSYGMKQMVQNGLKFAIVVNGQSNEASRNLYRSCGFRPWHNLLGYEKKFKV